MLVDFLGILFTYIVLYIKRRTLTDQKHIKSPLSIMYSLLINDYKLIKDLLNTFVFLVF